VITVNSRLKKCNHSFIILYTDISPNFFGVVQSTQLSLDLQ